MSSTSKTIHGTFTGKDLAAFKERHGLTGQALQDATGIHRNTQRNYERDNKQLPLPERLALAAFEASLKPVTRSKGASR